MAQQQPAPFPDTAHFLDAANDSARSFRAVYAAYLIIASYIAVTIFSADNELLFRNGNVQIPIINTSATVKRFFIFAPVILLLLHLNVLIQAMFLSTKVHRYISALDDDRHTPAFYNKERNAPGLLFPAPLAHLLVADDRRRGTQWILRAIVFSSIVLLPPIILIYAEIHFLTYQSEPITWMHRIAIPLDIFLLWRLWPRIVAPDKGWKEYWRQSPWKHRIAKIVSAATGFFVLVIVDIPGGTMEKFIFPNALHDSRELLDRRYQLEEKILVQEEPPPEILATHLAECKSQNPDGQTDCQTEIKPGTPIWCQYAKPLPLQGRAFRYAYLYKAVLCEANLLETKLEGADLRSAKLQGADLRSTKLQGANLYKAELQGADLYKAELQGADLRWAELQGADLSWAELQGADLSWAELQGADLRSAELQGADLSVAQLQGANLRRAQLQSADLSSAQLQGADLRRAQLQSAYLHSAELQGADLYRAQLQGTDLRWTELQGADLIGAQLQGANLRRAQLQGADLRWTELQGTDLGWADLQGADLRWAYLAGSDILNANLNLADLRDVDLESKPNQEQLQKAIAIIKNIKQQKRRDQTLELVKRAEMEKATITPSSIEDAIFSEGSALYKRLQEPESRELLKTHYFTQIKEEDYNTKLAAYLIDSLSCGDEDSYVAEGIIRPRIIRERIIQAFTLGIENKKLTSIFAKKLNLDSKVPSLLCQGVEKHLERLSEEERTELREIFAESANQ